MTQQPSVILATASYDHTIRFWEAKSGRCYRTIQYPESVSWIGKIVSFFTFTNVVVFVCFFEFKLSC